MAISSYAISPQVMWNNLNRYGIPLCFGFVLLITGQPSIDSGLFVLGLVIGILHGLSDVYLLQHIAQHDRLKLCGLFAAYFMVAILTFITYVIYPVFSIIVFLLISAQHFARYDMWTHPTSNAACLLRGLFYLSVLIILHLANWLPLISSLTAVSVADISNYYQQNQDYFSLGIQWLFLMNVLFLLNRPWQECAEFTLLTGFFLWLNPITTFVVYFLFIHSVRQLNFVHTRLKHIPSNGLLYGVTGIVTLLLLALLSITLNKVYSTSLVQSIFIFLLAITLPHECLNWRQYYLSR